MVDQLAVASSDAFTIRNGEVLLRLPSAAYSVTAIKKTAYRFAKDFATLFDPPAEGVIPIHLVLKVEMNEARVRQLMTSFLDDLMDQQLREEIGEETKPIRALILAHAFSRAGVVGRE